MPLRLGRPAAEHLPAYREALLRGWSPDNIRLEAAALEQLAAIARDPDAFLDSLVDPTARGGPIILPDGGTVARLPSFRWWMWADGFCGSIGFRWQKGTAALPAHVLGHVGYAVVPWRRREGHATRALALLLDEISGLGLPYVEVTTEPENEASIRVITANSGVLVERFVKPAAFGGAPGLRFRIAMPGRGGAPLPA